MANENMTLSSAGYALLRLNEGVQLRYYNDNAPGGGNCTWGVGTLAHFGPCTTEELHRQVTADQVNQHLLSGVMTAERDVRRAVQHHQLTQDQFDAAVSFAYNVRPPDAALAPADQGNMQGTADLMMHYVYIHQRDAQGHPIGPAIFSHGLFLRRQRESAPFRNQSTP